METISRKDLAPQEAPQDGWQIIEAHGNWPHVMEDGSTITAVIDTAAVAALVSAGVPAEGLLVDKDHLSHDMANSTQAYAWVRRLAACPSAADPAKYDLAAWLEFTALGKPLVQGKVYKHFSTEYELSPTAAADLGSGRFRPLRLVGLALTNRPNNGGQRPIFNRFPATTTTQTNTHTNMLTNEEYNALCAKLGLDADASFDAVSAAIDALFTDVQNAEEAAAEELVENTDTEGELTEEEKDMFEREIVANRERGLRLLKNRLGKKTSVRNRGGVNPTRPRSVLGKTASVSRIANRARELQAQGMNNGNWTKCYNQARRELNA